MRKKILIVSRSFYPQNTPRSLRATELAKEFSRQGHDVTVLTPKNTAIHSLFEEEHGITIKDLGTPKWKNPDFGNSKIGYLLSRICFRFTALAFEYPDIELMFKVIRKLKKEQKYDLLISIAVPHPIHWGVARLWAKGIKIADTWIADCGDPYMLATSDTFKKTFYFKYFEKSFCRNAHYVTVPIEGAKDAYYPEFRNKIKVIPQGFNFPDKKPAETVSNNVITFAYTGTIGPYRHYAIPFFEFLNSVTAPFIFKIYTKEKDFYQKYMSSETLSKCEFHDYTPREELLDELTKVDFFLYFPYLKPHQKPLKLIDYHFVGKPILEYKNDEQSKNTFTEFIAQNFTHKIPDEDIGQYRIENVCKSFLKLSKQTIVILREQVQIEDEA